MLKPITIRYSQRACRRSLGTGRVCDLFGLGEDPTPHVVAEDWRLELRAGEVVLFTGPSGSGKSSLLRAVASQLRAVNAREMPLPSRPVIDLRPGPGDAWLSVLSGCGLGEARLLLRRPEELSDGQRERLRIALALATARDLADDQAPTFLVLDEFAAILDRPLARVLAYNVARQVRQFHLGLLAATTHQDLTEDLNPDVHVRCEDGRITSERREGKKNHLACWASCGCLRAPSPTGRTSLGGITGAVGRRSSDA